MAAERVLIADADGAALDRLCAELIEHGCDVLAASSADELLILSANAGYDIAVIDLALPGLDAFAAAHTLAVAAPDAPLILMGHPAALTERCPDLLAASFAVLQEPLGPGQLAQAVERAAELRRLREENFMLRAQWEERESPDDFSSRSPRMIDALRQAATAADTAEPIALYGPPGTETDIVALYVHRCSRRARGPFVRFDCGRGPAAFEEARLFGHNSSEPACAAGGAGYVELAGAGTLFLDNVEELAPHCQAKLLRFIEEGQFLAAGASAADRPPSRADVRIISASMRDPRTVAEGRELRHDLFYRLNAFSVAIPPLSDRPEDVRLLARRFLRRFALEASKNIRAISPEAERLLAEYAWPGNVEELKDCIRTAVAGAEGGLLLPEDLLRGPCRTEVSGVIGGVTGPTLEDAQRQLIVKTLNETHGDRAEAARRLCISAAALAAKVDRYEADGLIASAAAGPRETDKCWT